jgi:CheY-like chemotaxis protein
MQILYVENHPEFVRIVIPEFLSGYQATVAASLASASEALTAGSFDLVLCDYDLDDGKGDAFVLECRNTHPALPVIAVSSHDAGNAALVRAGASAVCDKLEFHRIGQVIQSVAEENRRQSDEG